MRRVDLSDEELLFLDGKVNVQAQIIVDWVKEIRKYSEAGAVAELIAMAIKEGRIQSTYRELKSCNACDKKPEIYKYRRRGQQHQKTIAFRGIAFFDGFVFIQCYSEFGYCEPCGKAALDQVVEYIIRHSLPVQVAGGMYVREILRECFNCKAHSGEFDMGLEPTLMGDGLYYGKCPRCGAAASIFQGHKEVGFQMVEAVALKQLEHTRTGRKYWIRERAA